MLLKKQGFPEEDELVLCTVTDVQFHSVFVTLDEYGGRTGLVHISEIAPGRIRNIRDYVAEGKKIVCKVLRISQEKGHIDLSLRRVNESQKRNKLNQVKQEQLAEKIVENTAKQQGISLNKLYEDLAGKLIPKYGLLFNAFEAIANDQADLEGVVDKKIAKELTESIKQRIKPPEIIITGDLKLATYAPNGIEIIKKILAIFEKEKDLQISYKGAGTHLVKITSTNYKDAEKKLKIVMDSALDFAKKNKATAEFIRKEE